MVSARMMSARHEQAAVRDDGLLEVPSRAASRRSSGTCSEPRKSTTMAATKATKTTTMTGPRLVRKAMKSSPAAEPMRMLGGSPMRVAVPPMLEARIMLMR